MTANVGLFIGELRNIIEDDCGFKILAQLEKKGSLEGVRIPYSKVRSVVGKFVARNAVENGTEAFMESLKNQYPTVNSALLKLHTEFSLGYQDFVSFTVGIFSKKSQSVRIDRQAEVDVEFVNTFKSFKSKN